MMSATILVIAAHPDDEILGCGGTIARHVAAGDSCHSLILGEGATSRDPGRNVDSRENEINALRHAGVNAATVLGAESPRYAGLPDNRFDSLPLLDIVKIVETVITELGPAIIYTHHGGDLNIDHQLTYSATLTACRPLPESTIQRIDTFETVSSTEWGDVRQSFIPNLYVDVSEYIDQKLKALSCYEYEMRDYPHARSCENIRALATYRGASAGVSAAEAFCTVREIVR